MCEACKKVWWMLRFDVNSYLSHFVTVPQRITRLDPCWRGLCSPWGNSQRCSLLGAGWGMDEAWSERFWKRRLIELTRVDKEFDLSIEHSRFVRKRMSLVLSCFRVVQGRTIANWEHHTRGKEDSAVPCRSVHCEVHGSLCSGLTVGPRLRSLARLDEVWHIFRAADGLSWVIDSEANPVQTVRWC